MPENKPGLRDVIAGQTKICWLDEPNQNFYYRSYSIQDLAEHSTFEEVAYLLLYGKLPDKNEFGAFQKELRNKLATCPTTSVVVAPPKAHRMDLLASIVENCGVFDPERYQPSSLERDLSVAKMLIANMHLWCDLLSSDSKSGKAVGKCARDFLYSLHGITPTDLEVQALDLAAILYAEHEFNASTFAVRIAASAHTDLYSAVIAGISVLKGGRHGGANEEAMKLMLDISDPSKVSEYLEKFFAKPGARLPGFGHAVYTRSDPRVAILRPWVKKLSEFKGDLRWYEIALALEEYMAKRAAEKGKGIPANADLWTAPLYYLLGIPIELYTPLFAASRVAGWCAHYLEVRYENREPILRPRAEYVGPTPTPYIQIDDRI